jgi:phage shock protein C
VSSLRKPFQLNRDEGKVMGVCAGIADHFDIDVTLVRIGMALTILATFPLMLVVYFIMAAVAQQGSRDRRRPARTDRGARVEAPSADATRQRMRDLDARMQSIETYVTTNNSALAREIEELR